MNKILLLAVVLVVLWSVPAYGAEIAEFNDMKINSLGQTYNIYFPGHIEINSTVIGPFNYYDEYILHVTSNTTVTAEIGCKDNAYYPISIRLGDRNRYLVFV